MKPNRFVQITLLSVSSVLLVALGIVYLVDPYELYRRSNFAYFAETNNWHWTPAIIRHEPYDVIVLGSSMVENIPIEQISNKTKVKWTKLPMTGSRVKEQAAAARLVAKTGKTKQMIWGLDYFSLQTELDDVLKTTGPFPYYLYDTTIINDLPYLLNGHILLLSLKRLMTNPTPSRNFYPFKKQSKGTIDDIDQDHVRASIVVEPSSECELEKMFARFKKHVEPVLRENPQIKFSLFLPPYSFLYYRLRQEKDPKYLDRITSLKQKLIEALTVIENVKIYDFQNKENITHDPKNYSDLMHYHSKISEKIMLDIWSDSKI